MNNDTLIFDILNADGCDPINRQKALLQLVKSVTPKYINNQYLIVESNNNFGYNEYTPLHISAMNEQITETRILLKYGANPNIRDLDGDTPLHMTIDNQNYPLSGVLINSGASFSIRNNDERTPLNKLLKLDNNTRFLALLVRQNHITVDDLKNSDLTNSQIKDVKDEVQEILKEERKVKRQQNMDQIRAQAFVEREILLQQQKIVDANQVLVTGMSTGFA